MTTITNKENMHMFKNIVKSMARGIGSISAVAVEGFKEGYENPYGTTVEEDVIDVDVETSTI
tara:strand:- start:791 stop:976 length:186 start_codon:yes stop_codon:yes gene_type:complete